MTLKHKRTHTTNRMSNFARADQAHLEEAGMVGGMTAKYTKRKELSDTSDCSKASRSSSSLLPQTRSRGLQKAC